MTIDERKTPEWLKNLQENSWELELLISGGAIFSLFKLSDLFIEFIGTLTMTSNMVGGAPLLILGMIGVKSLTFGFIIHLLLRAYWLALVCINHVHPTGIKTSKINWKKPFKIGQEEGGDLQEQITQIDRKCGTVIYMAIISAFAITGIALAFMFLVGVMKLLEGNDSFIAEFAFTTLVLILIVYIFDLISFGLLRKTPYLSYLLFPFFKMYDVLTFRKYYQISLWLLNTNINRLKFFFGAAIFAFFSFCLTYLSIYQVQHWPNLLDQREFRWKMADRSYLETGAYIYEGAYMDKWDENSFHSIGIDSKVQQNNLMELFVRYDRFLDPLIHQTSDIDSLKSFDKISGVAIDDSIITGLQWMPTRKLNESIIGITTMVPIHHLENGLHKIQVFSNKRYENEHTERESDIYGFTIAFWVDRNK